MLFLKCPSPVGLFSGGWFVDLPQWSGASVKACTPIKAAFSTEFQGQTGLCLRRGKAVDTQASSRISISYLGHFELEHKGSLANLSVK